MSSKKSKSIPFAFVLDELYSLNIEVRPMFGCHALYLQNKIVLILRKKEDHVYDNGVWLATTPEHHASLKKVFPSLRSLKLMGENETAWQNIPESADDFEEEVLLACTLIRQGDPRIGKIPKPRKGKKSKI